MISIGLWTCGSPPLGSPFCDIAQILLNSQHTQQLSPTYLKCCCISCFTYVQFPSLPNCYAPSVSPCSWTHATVFSACFSAWPTHLSMLRMTWRTEHLQWSQKVGVVLGRCAGLETGCVCWAKCLCAGLERGCVCWDGEAVFWQPPHCVVCITSLVSYSTLSFSCHSIDCTQNRCIVSLKADQLGLASGLLDVICGCMNVVLYLKCGAGDILTGAEDQLFQHRLKTPGMTGNHGID